MPAVSPKCEFACSLKMWLYLMTRKNIMIKLMISSDIIIKTIFNAETLVHTQQMNICLLEIGLANTSDAVAH